MTNQQLINLLESFMDGQTTVEQETQLADFFRQATDADRPEGISNDDWQAYCEMFRMFENGMEDHTATIRPVETDASEKKHRILPLRWMTAAASVAVLLVGTLTLWNHTTDQPQPIAQSQPAITPVETDTVAVDRRQIPLDSITPPAKTTKRKIRRLHSVPPPPKEYLAETGTTKTVDKAISQADLDEAVAQAELLLQAMQLQQMVELNDSKMQYLQAMDALDAEEEEYVEQ